MSSSDHRSCIVIAVTESCPVQRLWEVAIQHAVSDQADVVALYIADERWHRAASLPFTREISRLSGGVADFTSGRAEQVSRDIVDRARQQLEQLASDSKLRFAFKVLSGPDPQQIKGLTGGGRNVLVASSVLRKLPVYAHFEQLDWRIELIESAEGTREGK
ncbi:MAG: hypothetical protein KJO31_02930 [Gammaproteobacteria bacterium]|nr:hypothetical protein [Gammaproteobacteria bacterium]